MFLTQPVILFLGYLQIVYSSSSPAFVVPSSASNKFSSCAKSTLDMTDSNKKYMTAPCPHPFSELPGDPSLILVTNLDLGDKKLDIMKQCSKAISTATGKPESYIGKYSFFLYFP
jgi:hypothetical protein